MAATDSSPAPPPVDAPPPAAAADAPPAAEPATFDRRLVFQVTPAWLISLVVHLTLFVALALTILPPPQRLLDVMTAATGSDPEQLESLDIEQITERDQRELDNAVPDSGAPLVAQVAPPTRQPQSMNPFANSQVPAVQPFSQNSVQTADLLAESGALQQRAFDGRGQASRRAMMERFGGTAATEAAVANALRWIAAHQLADGGWDFDHTIGPGNRISPNPGTMRARNAATALALLPFLGAGQTHQEGAYKEVVAAGLEYLKRRQSRNGAWWEPGGRMYSHGLAAIVVCEAFAMTGDPELAAHAQMSINYLAGAQDRVGGGWRYDPGDPGDTSVVGWQFMALKSASMSGLLVPSPMVAGVERFLDAMSANGGATYGYDRPGSGDATTAIGLLCRMYMGWTPEHPAIRQGVDLLARVGPSDRNIYFNYYASQVLKQYEGPLWEAFNDELRTMLVDRQVKAGPAAGTWYFPDDHGGGPGGRLYSTAMAAMILEVYYRHMPLYDAEMIDEEFPL